MLVHFISASGLTTNKCRRKQQTFKALERLKDLDKRLRGELFVVLGSDLDTDLQVLANVGLQHSFDALQRVLNRQRAKVVHQPLRVQQVSMNHGTFYVVQVRVVLQCLHASY